MSVCRKEVRRCPHGGPSDLSGHGNSVPASTAHGSSSAEVSQTPPAALPPRASEVPSTTSGVFPAGQQVTSQAAFPAHPSPEVVFNSITTMAATAIAEKEAAAAAHRTTDTQAQIIANLTALVGTLIEANKQQAQQLAASLRLTSPALGGYLPGYRYGQTPGFVVPSPVLGTITHAGPAPYAPRTTASLSGLPILQSATSMASTPPLAATPAWGDGEAAPSDFRVFSTPQQHDTIALASGTPSYALQYR